MLPEETCRTMQVCEGGPPLETEIHALDQHPHTMMYEHTSGFLDAFISVCI